jgi:putative component of toxin-antitoxin plasmid stabilization module
VESFTGIGGKFPWNTHVLLLIAGTKRTQARDMEKAKEYWRDYNA